jgi:hypothetical protein
MSDAEYAKYTAQIHEYTARIAYELWKERGCPYGSPEVDWFEAQYRMREDLNMSRTQTGLYGYY